MKEVADLLESTVAASVAPLQAIHEGTASQRPDTGKWSKKETLGHLVDSAVNNHQRFVRLQLQQRLDLPGYDGDEWVRVQSYQELPWPEIVDLWRAMNRHLAHLIRTVDAQSLKHTWRTPGGETVDLEFIMRDYITHMKHHLGQILRG